MKDKYIELNQAKIILKQFKKNTFDDPMVDTFADFQEWMKFAWPSIAETHSRSIWSVGQKLKGNLK